MNDDSLDFSSVDANQEFQMASDGQRIVAYLIDVGLVIVASFVPLIGWLVGMAYMITRDALPFLDGLSVGKRIMKIRAVDENNAPLTENWGPALVRNVVLLIPFFPIVELIILLTNDSKLRLGDQWAKTKVIVDPNAG